MGNCRKINRLFTFVGTNKLLQRTSLILDADMNIDQLLGYHSLINFLKSDWHMQLDQLMSKKCSDK